MKAREMLERARRIASRQGVLTGVVRLCYPDAEPEGFFKTVDMADYPPGPERERLLRDSVVMTGTQEDWVSQFEKEDKEARR